MDIYIDKTSIERVCEIEEGKVPESIMKLDEQIRKLKKEINRKKDDSNNQAKEKQKLHEKEEKIKRSMNTFVGWLSNQIISATITDELTLYIAHGKFESVSRIDECQKKFISVVKRKCQRYGIELTIEDIDKMPDVEIMSLDDYAASVYKMLNVTRYTKDVWFKTNPDSTEEQFQMIATPYNPYDFIVNLVERVEDINFDEIDAIRLVTLGQEYLDWLKENGLKNNEKNRIKYINSIDTDEADQIMKKYHYDRVLSTSAFFVSLKGEGFSNMPRKTVFRLEKEDKERITEILENIYGEGNVYVPGCIVKPDVYILQRERFEQMALDYFVDGKESDVKRWMEQKFAPDTNISAVVIPVFLWDEIDSCVISAAQYTYEGDQTTYYNDTLSDDINQSIQECTEIGQIIRNCFSERYEPIIYDCLVPIELVPEMYECIGEIMANNTIRFI